MLKSGRAPGNWARRVAFVGLRVMVIVFECEVWCQIRAVGEHDIIG